jgi:hypothetical protein
MVGVSLDGLDAVLDRVDHMARKLRHLDHQLAHELANWEVQDLHRKKPGMHRTHGGGKTVIRAHSRYELRRSRLAQRRIHYRGRTSTRDILRQELLDKLIARLDALMEERLTF